MLEIIYIYKYCPMQNIKCVRSCQEQVKTGEGQVKYA